MQEHELQRLLRKMRGNTLSPEESAQLARLFDTYNGKHDFIKQAEAEFHKLKEKRESLEVPDAAGVLERLKESIHLPEYASPAKQVRIRYLTVAIILMSCLSLGLWFWVNKPNASDTIEWVTVETKAGQLKEILLADSTKIRLNGSSKLSYPKVSLPKLRIVRFEGEAFFDMAKNANKPFLIVSKDFTTQVLGTSFTIDSEIEPSVWVKEGKVRVIGLTEAEALQAVSNMITSTMDWSDYIQDHRSLTTLLIANEKAHWQNHTWHKSEHNRTEWSLLDLMCNNEPLSQIADKFYRIYGQQVVLSPDLKSHHLTIKLKHEDPKNVLQILAHITNAKLIERDNTIWEMKKQ